MKRKLLIFHPVIAPYRMDLFNDLSCSFETQIWLTNCKDKTFDYQQIFQQLCFSPFFLEQNNNQGHRKRLGYWQLLDETNPDIVIVGEYGMGVIKVLLHRFLKRKKYKVVTICDDSYDMLVNDNDFSLVHKIARNVLAPRMDEIITVEPKVTEWYQHYCGKGICFPIIRSDGKYRELLKQILPQSQMLMKEHHLEHKNVFAFVGRFVALKNIGHVIKAFARMNQEDNALVLIGSGEEESSLRSMTTDLHANVIFTGRLEGSDLYAWYNVIDYFVLASTQEAFGAVTNEALMAGCYSLISNKAGSHCLIKEGENGATFNPMNIDELYAKMEWVATTFPRQRPLDKIKENLMVWKYDEEIQKLTEQLINITVK